MPVLSCVAHGCLLCCAMCFCECWIPSPCYLISVWVLPPVPSWFVPYLSLLLFAVLVGSLAYVAPVPCVGMHVLRVCYSSSVLFYVSFIMFSPLWDFALYFVFFFVNKYPFPALESSSPPFVIVSWQKVPYFLCKLFLFLCLIYLFF